MALYVDENIPAENNKYKKFCSLFSLEGNDTDKGEGIVTLIPSLRKVDPDTLEPILDESGGEIIKLTPEEIKANLADDLGWSHNGTTLAEVVEFMGAYFEYKVGS